MDKYTVDLDKVLNDFEYSELTTTDHQHVRPHSYNNNNNNRVNKDVTKHSINNVFHSLNEYLNTDVGDGSDVIVADNNCEVAKEETINPLVVDLLSGDDIAVVAEEVKGSDEAQTIVVEENKKEEESEAVIVEDTVEVVEEPKVEILKEETEDEEIVVTESGKEETVEEIEKESAIVGFNQPVDFEEAELNQYLEQLEEEEEKIDECTNKTEDEKVEVEENLEEKNCVTRPDSLPLDNREQKKDINLIGTC